jgi:hypothetical protein
LTKTNTTVPVIENRSWLRATTTEPTDQKIVTSPLLDTLKIKAIEEQTQIATATTIKTEAVLVFKE